MHRRGCTTRTALVFVFLLAVGLIHAQDLSISLRRAASSNLITLECQRGGSIVAGSSYFVQAPAGSSMELPYTLASQGSVSFEITPDQEGRYFCRDSSSMESTNNLELVAFPEPNPEIEQVTTSAAQVGVESVRLQCEFAEGRRRDVYTFKWFKGASISPLPQNSKYQILAPNTLLIKNVEFEDEGDYHCDVIVDNPIGNDEVGEGRNIHVEVYDAVTITDDGIGQKRVVQESDDVTFTCVAEGHPTPDIVWLFNGNDLQDDIFKTFEISGSEVVGDQVTSTLTVRQARDIHSGEISCKATNKPVTLEETFTATSTAILTVLSNNIENLVLTTALQNNIVYIHFTLPAKFQEDLMLIVEFTDEDSSQAEDEEFRNTGALNNTLDVHYQIPPGQLPKFSAFRVKIALRLDDEMGPFTAESNPIEKGVEPLQTSEDTVKDYISEIVVGVVVLAGIVLAAIVIIKCKRCECMVPTVCRNSGGEAGQTQRVTIRVNSDGGTSNSGGEGGQTPPVTIRVNSDGGTDFADAAPPDYDDLKDMEMVDFDIEPHNMYPANNETLNPADHHHIDPANKQTLSPAEDHYTDPANEQTVSPAEDHHTDP